MRPWIKQAFFALLLIIAVWVLVVFYWHTHSYNPSLNDVYLFLAGIPMALLAFIFLVNSLAHVLIGQGINPASMGLLDMADVSMLEAPRQQVNLVILSGHCITKFGADSRDLLAALREKTDQFSLDAELVDSQGYPILSGRIHELDEGGKFSLFGEWLASHGHSEALWLPEDRRAMALAFDAVQSLGQDLFSLPAFSSLLSQGLTLQNDADWPLLQLLALWPDTWPTSQQSVASEWLKQLLSQQGWPAEKLQYSPIKTAECTEAFALISQLDLSLQQQDNSNLYLLLASQSFIGEKTINDWEATGQLFMADNKNGIVPGEAAAGLVFANATLAAKLTSTPLAELHPIIHRRRDNSVDEPGKNNADALSAAINDALVSSGLVGDQIAKVFATTDMRSSRIVELMAAINPITTTIDVETDCIKLEASCGALGKVSGLIALILGRQQIMVSSQPVLCLCNNDRFLRSVAVLALMPGTSTPEDVAEI